MIFRVTWPYYIFKTKEKKMIYGIKASFPLDIRYKKGDLERDPAELKYCLDLIQKIVNKNIQQKMSYTSLMVRLCEYFPTQKALDATTIFFKRQWEKKNRRELMEKPSLNIRLDLYYYPGDIEKDPKELERCLVLAKKLIEANANIHVTKTTLTVSLADYMPVQKAKDVVKIFFKRLADEKETK
jgi:hypothetical protein